MSYQLTAQLAIVCDGENCQGPKRQVIYYGASRAECREQSIKDGWLLNRKGKAFCRECAPAYLQHEQKIPGWRPRQLDRNMMPLPRRGPGNVPTQN